MDWVTILVLVAFTTGAYVAGRKDGRAMTRSKRDKLYWGGYYEAAEDLQRVFDDPLTTNALEAMKRKVLLHIEGKCDCPEHRRDNNAE